MLVWQANRNTILEKYRDRTRFHSLSRAPSEPRTWLVYSRDLLTRWRIKNRMAISIHHLFNIFVCLVIFSRTFVMLFNIFASIRIRKVSFCQIYFQNSSVSSEKWTKIVSHNFPYLSSWNIIPRTIASQNESTGRWNTPFFATQPPEKKTLPRQLPAEPFSNIQLRQHLAMTLYTGTFLAASSPVVKPAPRSACTDSIARAARCRKVVILAGARDEKARVSPGVWGARARGKRELRRVCQSPRLPYLSGPRPFFRQPVLQLRVYIWIPYARVRGAFFQ